MAPEEASENRRPSNPGEPLSPVSYSTPQNCASGYSCNVAITSASANGGLRRVECPHGFSSYNDACLQCAAFPIYLMSIVTFA